MVKSSNKKVDNWGIALDNWNSSVKGIGTVDISPGNTHDSNEIMAGKGTTPARKSAAARGKTTKSSKKNDDIDNNNHNDTYELPPILSPSPLKLHLLNKNPTTPLSSPLLTCPPSPVSPTIQKINSAISFSAVAIFLSAAICWYFINDPVIVSVFGSFLAALLTWRMIPAVSDLFINAGISGKDMHKRLMPIIPESMGTIAGLVYVIIMFLFIPVPFLQWFTRKSEDGHGLPAFPHDRLGEFLSALLSLMSMIFLGFSDDVLNLRWRHKLFLPAIASLPLLMVYHVNHGVTWVVVPMPLRPLMGHLVDLGLIYYLYMGMLAVFCTNSINILAGINGVEVIQSLVIGFSILANSLLQLFIYNDPASNHVHLLSVFFILPFLGSSIGLALHNRYPSRVFVGDTYCYFAGMTFAVVGILGHFSKTVLLFFLPQIFNFIYSCPQLFRLIPCPRHRMPRYIEETDCVDVSWAPLIGCGVNDPVMEGLIDAKDYRETTLHKLVRFTKRTLLKLLSFFRLAQIQYDEQEPTKMIAVNNLTLLNVLLLWFGPMNEGTLAVLVGCVQVFGSLVGFFIRYYGASIFYGGS